MDVGRAFPSMECIPTGRRTHNDLKLLHDFNITTKVGPPTYAKCVIVADDAVKGFNLLENYFAAGSSPCRSLQRLQMKWSSTTEAVTALMIG